MLFSVSHQRDAVLSAWIKTSLLPIALLSILCGLAFLAGCGGSGGDDDTVLAIVGDREITASYYEKKLAKMAGDDLPRDDAGQPVDTATLAGKKAFLDILVNKDLCYLKGTKLGYLKDPQITNVREAMTDYEAGQLLHEQAVGKPSRFISNEELEAFYERWGESRICEYLMTNFEQEALDAREAILSGVPWSQAVASYHTGPPARGDKYEITIPFGQYGAAFEDGIFSVAEGEVSMPVETPNGFWLVRVNEITQRPKRTLEEVQDKIIKVKYNRKLSDLRQNFMKEVRDNCKLTFYDEALLKAWHGLPDEEPLFKPGTEDPVARESLKPLNVDPKDMDLPFYSYEVRGELRESSLGDYKAHFDRMNVFQRPKKVRLVGGLRSKITQELTMVFLKVEGERRGLNDDPEVLAKVYDKVEEMIVGKIFSDVVTYDKTVSPEDGEAYWALHKDEFDRPEGRRGYIVKIRDLGKAEKAVQDAREGMEWSSILELYGSAKENVVKDGFLDFIFQNTADPVTSTLFALAEPGQVSDPVILDNGLLAVVKLDEITPPRARDISEVYEAIGRKIKAQRQDDAFNALLDEWATEFGVEIFEDKLLETDSWAVLQEKKAQAFEAELDKE